MSESKELFSIHEFKVQKLVEVPSSLVQAAEKGISMVWNEHMGRIEDFSLVFASRIFEPKTGKDTGWSANYDPDKDSFSFALETIKERMRFGLPDEITMLILAAHESTHKVQFQRGDSPRPSPKSKDMDTYYDDDRHEVEAWKEAIQVLKAVYPNAIGRVTVGKKRYVIPIISKYSENTKFHLKGHYLGSGEIGYGGCVTEALNEAGYEVDNIPEWIRFEDMEPLCQELGLIWNGKAGERVTIDQDQPVIILFETKNKKGHALFVDDAGPILGLQQALGRQILGI